MLAIGEKKELTVRHDEVGLTLKIKKSVPAKKFHYDSNRDWNLMKLIPSHDQKGFGKVVKFQVESFTQMTKREISDC